MSDINRAVYLYDIMAKRFEKSGVAPNQARVYAETRDLIKDCKTVTESMQKIKNSKYYTAPAQALMLDKMYAFKRAALDDNMQDLAQVFDEKYKEIEADWMKAYETGYETKAQGIEYKHELKVSAFSKIYTSYIEMLCVSANKNEIQEKQKELSKAFSELNQAGGDFYELAKDERFRRLVCANDFGYQKFVNEVVGIMQNGVNLDADANSINAEFNEMWKLISSNKQQVIDAGKGELARYKNSAAIAVPPKDRTGKYEFVMIEEE